MLKRLSENDKNELWLIASGASGAPFTPHQVEVLHKHYADSEKIPQGVTWMTIESFHGWLRNQLNDEYNHGRARQMLMGL